MSSWLKDRAFGHNLQWIGQLLWRVIIKGHTIQCIHVIIWVLKREKQKTYAGLQILTGLPDWLLTGFRGILGILFNCSDWNKKKGASKGSSQRCQRRTIFGSTKKPFSQRFFREPSLSYLFIIWRTFFCHKKPFVKTGKVLQMLKVLYGTFRQKGFSMGSWSTFIFKNEDQLKSARTSKRTGGILLTILGSYRKHQDLQKCLPRLCVNIIFYVKTEISQQWDPKCCQTKNGIGTTVCSMLLNVCECKIS